LYPKILSERLHTSEPIGWIFQQDYEGRKNQFTRVDEWLAAQLADVNPVENM
jgi:hypothetical protein